MVPAEAILAAIPDPVVVVGADARLRWANTAAAERFGWSPETFLGRDVSELVHPDDVVTAMSSLESVQRRAVGSLVTLRLRDRSGEYGTFEVRGGGNGVDSSIGGVVLVLRDVTDRARWDVDGGAGEVGRTILQHAPGITMVLTATGELRGATRAFSNVLALDLERTLGLPLWQLVVPEDRDRVQREITAVVAGDRRRSFEASMHRPDAPTVPLQVTVVNLLDDPSVNGLVVTALDISPLVEARAKLQHHASHDQLTGLVNRRCLRELLADHQLEARRTGEQLAVIYCDIDGFKHVNDRLGHRSGDEVLVEVARRFREVLRDCDVVGRYGGDEFVVLLRDADEVAATRVVARLASALDEPIRLADGASVRVRASAGHTLDDGTSDLDELLAKADSAMYRAKRVLN